MRERLDERERFLQEQVARRRAGLEQPAAIRQAADDAADLAAARAHDDVQNTLIDQYLREIEAIEQARERVESGAYGTCVECGEQIGLHRLRVRPVALRCAGCQHAHETSLAAAARRR